MPLDKIGRFFTQAHADWDSAGLDSFESLLTEARAQLSAAEGSASDWFRLRVAASLAVDYTKCVLDVAGREVDAPVTESQNLPRKFELVADRRPQLQSWEAFVVEAEALRNLLAHTDHRLPAKWALSMHILKAANFRRSVARALIKPWAPGSPGAEIENRTGLIRKELARIEADGPGGRLADLGDILRSRIKAYETLHHTLADANPSAELGLLRLVKSEVKSISRTIDSVQRREREEAYMDWLITKEEEAGGPSPARRRRTRSRGSRKGSRLTLESSSAGKAAESSGNGNRSGVG